jgi:hypothetical protein
VILRVLAAAQDRYAAFRYRKYRAAMPLNSYAGEAVAAYMRSDRYREIRYGKYRPYVLGAVVAWMLIRRPSR